MANTWGSMELLIQDFSTSIGTFNRTYKKLIPSVYSLVNDENNTVIFSSGSGFKTITIEGIASISDYELLRADYRSGVTRNLVIPDYIASTPCHIQSLVNTEMRTGFDRVWYTITFMEDRVA